MLALAWDRHGKPRSSDQIAAWKQALGVEHLSLDAGMPEELLLLQHKPATVTGFQVYSPSESSVCDNMQGFAALSGIIDNLDELRRMAGIDAVVRLSVPELLWRLYLTSGSRYFSHLKGVFSLIIGDTSKQCFYLFRSPLIGKSLYYLLTSDSLVMASETRGVLHHPAAGNEFDDAWLASFFTFVTPQTSATPFRSVTELLPGELLSVTRSGHLLTRQPPGIGGGRIRYSAQQQYVERFDELVSRAVSRNMQGREGIGIMLSGGMDSVPLAYWMHRHQQASSPASVYSWSLLGFPRADESRRISMSAEMIGIPVNMLPGDEYWPLRYPTSWPLNPNSPQINAFRLLKQAVYTMAAADGCNYIFNGHYGDNLYPSYQHLLADALFEGKIGRFFSEAGYDLRYSGLRGLHRNTTFRGLAKRLLHLRRKPGAGADLTPYARGLIEQQPEWPPEMKQHPRPDQYRLLLGAAIARGINGEQYFTGLSGLELVEPYVDWDLVDFVLSVPAYLFYDRGMAKVLMREAMKGRIPEEVRTSPRTGLLDTFFHHGVDRRLEWMKQRLFTGETDWQRFVDPDYMRKRLDVEKPDERSKMLLLQCVAYEMWLDHYYR